MVTYEKDKTSRSEGTQSVVISYMTYFPKSNVICNAIIRFSQSHLVVGYPFDICVGNLNQYY